MGMIGSRVVSNLRLAPRYSAISCWDRAKPESSGTRSLTYTTPARRHPPCLQLVARIETQLRLRDGWMAEIEAVRSNELVDQAAARPKFQQPVDQDAGPAL